ncbi:MAG TPA: response regulator [Gammaproteobacteria bacterium]|nr:response regulator [Gammaproteobacteria bacterium]
MPTSREVKILLVEDDEIDVKALLKAFKKLKIANPVTVAKDGLEGWDALQKLERPYLLIMDINMPRMNGLELLRKIRSSKAHHDAIVFILTTSTDEKDKFEAYDLNVAGYMLKSDMGTSFIHAIEMVERYWRVIEFPGSD